MSSFKAAAHVRELKQRLSLSLAGAVMSDALDANGNPSLKIVLSGETQFVHVEALDNAGRVDALGLAQRSYSPHVCQILRDTVAADAAARDKVLAACTKLGMKLEIWEIAAVPASFTLAGAAKAYEISADEINPLTSSQ
jgi:hypothetical protein